MGEGSAGTGTGPARKLSMGAVTRQARTDAKERLQLGFAESHAGAVKHTVITVEKTIGRIKKYLQLKTVIAAKHNAKVHAVPRMSARVFAGRPPSCQANIAASKNNTLA